MLVWFLHFSYEFLSKISNRWQSLYNIANTILYKIKKKSMQTVTKFISLYILFLCIQSQTNTYNTSICSAFQLEGVYYKLNKKQQSLSWSSLTAQNIRDGNHLFNYCHQVQVYCDKTHEIINASLILLDSCLPYTQKNIQLIQANNISSGVRVRYQYVGVSQLNLTENQVQIVRQYPCIKDQNDENEVWKEGCPQVERSTIFHYFNENQLGFTITVGVIGVLFMVFGVYIYRLTILLIAGVSIFMILLAAETPLIFEPGVPTNLITNVLIINGLIGLFFGYIFGYFPKVGSFFLGAWIGFIISLTLNNIAFYFIISQPANLTLWIVMPILCVLFGILALFIRKTFIIFATSLIGAYLCLRALSWHLGNFPNQFLLSRKFQLDLVGPVTWQYYLYVISLIILTASSSALQYWLFQKKLKNAESKDFDNHFENIESQLKNKRENLVDFENVFKKKQKDQPKRLNRKQSKNSKQEFSYYSDEQNSQEDQSDGSQSRSQAEEKKEKSGLNQNLLQKNRKK